MFYTLFQKAFKDNFNNLFHVYGTAFQAHQKSVSVSVSVTNQPIKIFD